MNLQKSLEAAIKYSQNYFFPLDCEEIITSWEINKAKLNKEYLNEKITLQLTDEPVSITLDETFRRDSFFEFIDKVMNLLEPSEDAPDSEIELYYHFYDFLSDNVNNFYSNIVTSDFLNIVKRGSKIIKSFKYFVKDKQKLRKIQDMASELIQTQKISGYLFASIDPFEFLTSSENNCNWRSCHSLDGDYRAGNISYMNDPSTIIVFLANEEKINVDCLPKSIKVYNKKWRMLIHINQNDNIIYYGRQYPSYNKNLLDLVYSKLFCDKGFMPPKKVTFDQINLNQDSCIDLDHNYMALNNKVFDTLELIDIPENSLNYNDIVYSSFYQTQVSINRKYKYYYSKDKQKTIDLFLTKIGYPVACACGCGRKVNNSASFICDICAEKYNAEGNLYPICSCCGKRINLKDKQSYKQEEEGLYCSLCWRGIKSLERQLNF